MSPEAGGSALLWVLATPLIGAVLIALAGRLHNIREAVTLTTAAVLLAQVVAVYLDFLEGARPAVAVIDVLDTVSLAFRLEPLGMMFMLVAGVLWIVNSVYSIGYMRGNRESNQTRFYVCFAVAIAATMGLAMAENLFTLFVFYEILTLSTYPLVTHAGTGEAREGGRVYLGILISTSIGLLLVALMWTWQAAGTLDFRPGGILGGTLDGPEIGLLLFLFMYGTGKAALMPMHRWLPAAMVAPTPVSALLHAVAVVKAGVFTVIKVIVYTFGLDTLRDAGTVEWLVWVAGGSILVASLLALKQDHLKRRLAYSTVSQLSYVTMAAALLAPLSVVGAAMHLAAHAFGKITLFFAAGSIHTAAHKDYVSQLDGIGRRMPWTMGAFTLGALSMIGVPPTVGFVSKWFILEGAWQSGLWGAVIVLSLSTVLNAAYFLPIVYRAFFRPLPREALDQPHGEAPLPIVLAISFTALMTLVLFAWPDVPLGLAEGLVGPPGDATATAGAPGGG